MKNVQVGILVLCTFFCFSRAQIPVAAKAPTLAIALGIDSILADKHIDRDKTSILADSAVRHIVSEQLIDHATTIVTVHKVEQGEFPANWHRIVVSGSLTRTSPPAHPEAFVFAAYVMEGVKDLPYEELVIPLEDNQDGFWDSILQPALVTLGAAAIVALFFLIRS